MLFNVISICISRSMSICSKHISSILDQFELDSLYISERAVHFRISNMNLSNNICISHTILCRNFYRPLHKKYYRFFSVKKLKNLLIYCLFKKTHSRSIFFFESQYFIAIVPTIVSTSLLSFWIFKIWSFLLEKAHTHIFLDDIKTLTISGVKYALALFKHFKI